MEKNVSSSFRPPPNRRRLLPSLQTIKFNSSLLIVMEASTSFSEKLPASCRQRGKSATKRKDMNSRIAQTRTVTSRAWQQSKTSTAIHWWNGKCFGVALTIAALVWLDVLLLRPSSPIKYNPRELHYSSDMIIPKSTLDKRYHHHAHGKHLRQSYQQQPSSVHPVDVNEFETVPTMADAIVVGSGLAGLTAALTILDRGGTVIVMEKEPILGGNSNKASSGINACCLEEEKQYNDTLTLFRDDTIRSAGKVADLALIDTLVDSSAQAVTWLHERVGIDLSVLAQLGGHSRKRTHRPHKGFVGAEIMAAMETAVRSYGPTGRVSIYLNTQVTQLISDHDGNVLGVISESRHGEYGKIRSNHVILATGGFASDRTRGSFLEKYRPELLQMPATAGAFSTGDGIAMAEVIGATTRDMEKIQLHPTGFVDPADPTNPNKVLAAEMLRGVGGILIGSSGERFCDELGTRDYVSGRMMNHNRQSPFSKLWNVRAKQSKFYLVLSEAAAAEAHRHVSVYTRQALITELHGIDELSNHMNIPRTTIHRTLEQYQLSASLGIDEFGKTVFENVPSADFETETFVVGEVTPVLHYCMGGLTIDTQGNVLRDDGAFIEGLHAAGEVTGGVHGNNRLGGNSLLECAVFGGIIGRNIPIDETRAASDERDGTSLVTEPAQIVSMAEVAKHRSPADLWVSLYGTVYDLTTFVKQHPGGAKSILSLGGSDGTKIFDNIHSPYMLDILKDRIVGVLNQAAASIEEEPDTIDELRGITLQELKQHSTRDDAWVMLYGVVYDLTEFSEMHPGGAFLIQKLAGKDGTDQFQVFHTKDKLNLVQRYVVGRFVQSTEGTEALVS